MPSLELFIALLCCLIPLNYCYIEEPGPRVKATKGEPWPKPQNQTKSGDYQVVRPHLFSFKSLNDDIGCPELLQDAFSRYWNIIANFDSLDRRGRFLEKKSEKKFWVEDVKFLGYLDQLNVQLDGKCDSETIRPDFGDVENYTLSVDVNNTVLRAPSIWGILRGLETFSQLIYMENDALLINVTFIDDFPRFPHRGLLLDTSRHFIPVYAIFQTLDAMSYNKLNVFHWHIVDDQSFPYKSEKFPELSWQGAFHPISKVYEQSDVQNVIEYARVRGIRIIPEFDTPGHTRCWGVSHPEILTECYKNGQKTGKYGPMDPTNEAVYTLLSGLFAEVVEVFPDSYFHIGGDEVDFDCWESNPNITAFMENNNITSYTDLESYFIQKVIGILEDLNAKYLVWEEVFVNGVEIPDTTVVHVWRDEGLPTMFNVTKAGKLALYSSCWYLDHLDTGGDWIKYYNCEPLDFDGTEDQERLVLGGEACMWAESVNEYNLISRVWPRASAAAEKLWSSRDVNSTDEAAHRLEEHACRMNHRGIGAQPPNGPGVCL